ncbi:hypothetical protein, partial [Nonomuraea lactucae]|uniref:hypothetical protein n=1 Tax=Nonomuraea lactucae TaxID=2249762 RepID=UPI0019660B2F
ARRDRLAVWGDAARAAKLVRHALAVLGPSYRPLGEAVLLAEHAPRSYAVPGAAGVTRWAGTRIGGRLAAVAADAWSAPSVGFLAGVATAAPFRGRGLAERVCRWVSRELVAAHGLTHPHLSPFSEVRAPAPDGLPPRRVPLGVCRWEWAEIGVSGIGV